MIAPHRCQIGSPDTRASDDVATCSLRWWFKMPPRHARRSAIPRGAVTRVRHRSPDRRPVDVDEDEQSDSVPRIHPCADNRGFRL